MRGAGLRDIAPEMEHRMEKKMEIYMGTGIIGWYFSANIGLSSVAESQEPWANSQKREEKHGR